MEFPDPAFVRASRRIANHTGEIDGNSVFWMRGILPKFMMVWKEGLEIHNAKIWESQNFTEVINRSRLGYSDGTGGAIDLATSIPAAAF